MPEFSGPTSHTYFSQRLRLHYVDWGNPHAPPVLLIHGGRDHCRNWDWVARSLRENFHVIAVDLRGHGDSQWITGGSYATTDFVYDVAQLIHQQQLAPVRIVAHSMGGYISLRYAGLYPEKVLKLVNIEGFGPSPQTVEERGKMAIDDGLRGWVKQLRKLSGFRVRRYPSVEDAASRMQEANPHLSQEQAHHLTIHGVNQNEDGTFSWKFDNYVRAFPATGISPGDADLIHSKIQCPIMFVRGREGWTSDPATDGRGEIYQDLRIEQVEKAGHWVHHDQLEVFLGLMKDFL